MVDIILVEPETAGNVGAIARVMSNFGFKKLVVVNPQCDLSGSEFKNRAKHATASLVVRKKIPSYGLLVATTAKTGRDYNIKRSAITPEQLAGKKMPKKTAIVFGREGDGLSNEEIDLCDVIVKIPASKKYPTLNLSHAVAIVCYELSKSDNAVISSMSVPEKKQLLKLTHDLIDTTSLSSEKKKVQKQLWKNTFSKALLSKREGNGIMALLRKLRK